nr:pro-neuregulin-2, membrane-bound isoform isoform X2 [Cavia porcellus]
MSEPRRRGRGRGKKHREGRKREREPDPGEKAARPKLKKMKSQTGQVGEKQSLKCEAAAGNPQPSYRWFKDGKELNRSRDIRIKYGNGRKNSRLQFNKVKVEDAGEYVCEAENILGKDTVRGRLHVNSVSTTLSSWSGHARKCNETAKSYCVNGGVCYYIEGINQLSCKCPNGFFGQRCLEKLPLRLYMPDPKQKAEELYQKRVLTITGICVALLVVGIVCVVAYCKTKKQRKQMHNHLRQNMCPAHQNRSLANGPSHPRLDPEEIQMADYISKNVPATDHVIRRETETTFSGSHSCSPSHHCSTATPTSSHRHESHTWSLERSESLTSDSQSGIMLSSVGTSKCNSPACVEARARRVAAYSLEEGRRATMPPYHDSVDSLHDSPHSERYVSALTTPARLSPVDFPLLAGDTGANLRDHITQLSARRFAAPGRAYQLPPGGAAAAPAAPGTPRPRARARARRRGHATQLRQLLLPRPGARASARGLRTGRQPGQPARQPLPHPGGRRIRDHAGVRAPAPAAATRARCVSQDVGGAPTLAPLAPQRAGGAARTRGAGLAVAEQRLGLRLGLGRRRGRRGRGAGCREHAFPRPARGARRAALGLAAAVPGGRQQDLLLPGQPQHTGQQQTQPRAAAAGQAGLGAPLGPVALPPRRLPARPRAPLSGRRQRPPTGESKEGKTEIKIFLFSIKGKKYNKMFYFHFSKNCLIILANGKDVFIGKLFICNILIYSFRKKRNKKKREMGQFFDSLIETYIVVPFAVRYSGAPGEKSRLLEVG